VIAVASFGIQELIVIFVLALVLLGPKSPRRLAIEMTEALRQLVRADLRLRYQIQWSHLDLALLAFLSILLYFLIALVLAT
jgi:hypothetical protein